MEIWKEVKDYEGMYEVSNLGNVRNFKTKHVLKSSLSKKGYPKVNLWKNKGYKTRPIHRLVAIAFIKNNLYKPQVNHIDGNKTNNRLDNLEWCTQEENMRHAVDMGLKVGMSGEDNGRCKITEKLAKKIIEDIKNGHRNIDIKNKYNVTKDIVSNIKSKKAWKHLSEEI